MPPENQKPEQTPKAEAWQLLHTACTGDKTSARATAVGVLGLLPDNTQARKIAEKALADEKPEVRSSAAAALGAMHSKASIAKLREAADDQDPSVALAAAHALIALNDDAGYEVYYEVLTGERKGGKGLIASQTAVLKDPKKMAELGIQEGIGFIPFAGMGWRTFKAIHKDDSSPVRAAAAKVLIRDPDPATTKALADAVGDKELGRAGSGAGGTRRTRGSLRSRHGGVVHVRRQRRGKIRGCRGRSAAQCYQGIWCSC